MLAKNILAVLAFVVAASATPVEMEKRNPCGSNQNLSCCKSISLGIGVDCVLDIASCDAIAVVGCCNQAGAVNVCIAL